MRLPSSFRRRQRRRRCNFPSKLEAIKLCKQSRRWLYANVQQYEKRARIVSLPFCHYFYPFCQLEQSLTMFAEAVIARNNRWLCRKKTSNQQRAWKYATEVVLGNLAQGRILLTCKLLHLARFFFTSKMAAVSTPQSRIRAVISRNAVHYTMLNGLFFFPKGA